MKVLNPRNSPTTSIIVTFIVTSILSVAARPCRFISNNSIGRRSFWEEIDEIQVGHQRNDNQLTKSHDAADVVLGVSVDTGTAHVPSIPSRKSSGMLFPAFVSMSKHSSRKRPCDSLRNCRGTFDFLASNSRENNRISISPYCQYTCSANVWQWGPLPIVRSGIDDSSRRPLFLRSKESIDDEIANGKDAVSEKLNPQKKTAKGSTKSKKNVKVKEPSHWLNKNDEFIIVSNGGTFIGSNGHTDKHGNQILKLLIGSEKDHALSFFKQFKQCNQIKQPNPTDKGIKFIIRGKPLPLIRHRSSRGFTYNPSFAAQNLFRKCVLDLLPTEHLPVIVDEEPNEIDIKSMENIEAIEHNDTSSTSSTTPKITSKAEKQSHNRTKSNKPKAPTPTTFFPSKTYLHMSLLFRMKRPKTHFIGNKPGANRLKPTAPKHYHTTRSDIDNLAKFIMDSLNGVLYDDDRQVVSLEAKKVLDWEGDCEGATEVVVCVVEDGDLNLF